MSNPKINSRRRPRALVTIAGSLLALVIAFAFFVSQGSAPGAPNREGTKPDQAIVQTQPVSQAQAQTEIPVPAGFNGELAFEDLAYQVALGPRIPGSAAHSQTVDWIYTELTSAGWLAELQETNQDGRQIRNVIGKRGAGGNPWIVLGAHFDSRIYADKDPVQANRGQAIDGANDGASGVAVLLELARVIPADLNLDIWLVFFDAEDNGGIEPWEWILGSRYFVANLEGKPDAAVILDMIGDADLNIYLEKGSDTHLAMQIWDTAAELGYEGTFKPTVKYSILDDHVPFLQAGIPAVDIIDFDYPYHHTLADSLDKVSPASLQIVGDTMLAWLKAYPSP